MSGRQPMTTIVTGKPGSGKTYQTIKELNLYVQQDASVGRPARKVLIFDTNDEFRDYRSVMYNVRDPRDNGIHLRSLVNPEIRRIVPYYPSANGTPMTMSFEDKEKTLIDIVNNYRDGLVLLEDINTYLVSLKSVETISALCAARHKGMDLIIQLQSLGAVEPRMFQNSTIIRMHYQMDDIARYKNRLNENYEPLKICQNIISLQHMKGNIRCFIYFNNETKKILNTSMAPVTKEMYDEGLAMYKQEHKNKVGFLLSRDPYMYYQA